MRREKVINDLNRSLAPLVRKDDQFKEASPNLFGPSFAKRSKEFMDQLQAMRPPRKQNKQPFFWKGPPSGRGVQNQHGAATGGESTPTTGAGVRTTLQETRRINEKRTDSEHYTHTTSHSISNKNPFSLYDEISKRKGHSAPICIRSTSRTATVLSEKLGNPNKGQMGPRNSKGLQNRVQNEPMAAGQSTPTAIQSVTMRPHTTGGSRANDERGNQRDCRNVSSRGGDILFNPFLSPKERWRSQTSHYLKALNNFVIAPHFKMEGIQTLKSLLRQGDWLVKIDLKDAYFAIPIREENQKFLCFSVANKSYQFTCLPFGLASAPWVFTKTLKPVVALCRELGVRLVIYIDDILVMAESREKAEDQASGLTYLLQCLGFTVGHLHFTGTELKTSYLMMGVTSGHSDGHVTLV